VWKGAERELAITPLGVVRLTARSDELADLGYRVLLSTPLVAPVLRGQRIGDLLYESKGKIVARIPLVAGADVQPAGLLRRAWDSVVLGISSLVRGSAAPADSALIPTTRTVIRASRQAGGA
jgi:D-alanyl-D-alanine carboxypeptidase (penicillin-binding protein 5/6)